MQFKLISVKTTGGTIANNDGTTTNNVYDNNGTFTQHINISVGVQGCPHDDIKVEKTVAYIFSENLTAKQAENGIETFAISWLNTNYPEITE